jgi:hypothetical protein
MINLNDNFTTDKINEKPTTVAKVFFQAFGRYQVDYFVNEISSDAVKRKLAYVCSSYVLFAIHWYDVASAEKLTEEVFDPPFQKDDKKDR